MNRRGFLLGTAACATVAAIGLPAATDELYGVSPAMSVLPAIRAHEQMMRGMLRGMSQKIEHTLIYGNEKFMPLQFTGFAPHYSA